MTRRENFEDTRANLTPVIALVGRTNVGKSTMFNRLLEERKAITSDEEGTTRDLNFGHFDWQGLTMTAIDTAGIDLTSDQATEEALKQQAELAMEKADIILMLTDAEAGLMPQDRALAKHLLQHRSDKPVLLVVNKADNPRMRRRAAKNDWLKLGLGEGLLASASNGSGVGDLLDVVTDKVKELGLDCKPLPEPDLTLALIGRPNAGKSSLLNALAGERRVIVSEIPHTTKEPQDTMFSYIDEESGEKRHLQVVDTVGIRRQSRVTPGLEYIGVGKSFKEMRQADIALLLLDAAEGVNTQDKKLAGMIEKSHVGIIVLANKWDLAEEERIGGAEDFREHLIRELPFCRWAPVLYISALSGRNVDKILPACLKVQAERQKMISNERMEEFLDFLKKKHGQYFKKGPTRPHVYGIRQVNTEPPTFEVVVKKWQTVHVNFLRFIENRLREEFGFEGTPIKVFSRQIIKSKNI